MLVTRLLLIFILISITPAHADIWSGLVGWWKFDEAASGACGGATVIDSSHSGSNTGTCNNNPTYVTGKIGQGAMSFNGTSQSVSLSIPAARANVITVSAWIYPTSAMSTRQDFFASGNSQAYSSNNWIFSIKGNTGVTGGLSVLGNNTSGNQNLSTGSAVLTTGKWFHVAFTDDGTIVKIYVNGILATNSALNINVGNNNGEYIGCSNNNAGNNNYFSGSIDDARIYNRALSSSEVAMLYQYGKVTINNSIIKNAKLY